jgi:hypothetical protein
MIAMRMRTLRPRVIPLLAALWLGLGAPARTLAASAEPVDIDDSLRAKMQMEKEKTKLEAMRLNAPGSDAPADTSVGGNNCDINIGNTQPKNGMQAISGRDTTVVVTGPVINVGQCSKH